jgi:hypothetical protein
MMPPYPTINVYLRNIIRLTAVHIPRFVTWRNLTEIFSFVDLDTNPW